jgi:hypothetical protein
VTATGFQTFLKIQTERAAQDEAELLKLAIRLATEHGCSTATARELIHFVHRRRCETLPELSTLRQAFLLADKIMRVAQSTGVAAMEVAKGLLGCSGSKGGE